MLSSQKSVFSEVSASILRHKLRSFHAVNSLLYLLLSHGAARL
jgi:hypothetical protein